ncbi:hypothetical protein N9M03_00445 [bacterium]|nr:hypothetical protein [bacterium]
MNWQRVGLAIFLIYGIGYTAKKLKLMSESQQLHSESVAGFQEPEYPEMVVESIVMRPSVNEYLNTEFGSAPLPSTSNFVAMIRGTPI